MSKELYEQLLRMYNNCNDEFWKLPERTLAAFFDQMFL